MPKKMTAIEALDIFLRQALKPRRSERYCDLIQRPKGQKRFLADLYHTLGGCFRAELSDTELTDEQIASPGFSYSVRRGFGVVETSIEEGFNSLMPDTGWLLVAADGTFGIYQPEDRIDDRRQIVA